MIGTRIRKLREKNDISQKQLAQYLKVSPSTIGMYEQERRLPSAQMLDIIAEFFNVSVDYLLGRVSCAKHNKNVVPYKIIEIMQKANIDIYNIDYDKLEQLFKLVNIEKEKKSV